MGAEEDLTHRVPAGIGMGTSLIPSALGSLTTLRAPPSPACPLLQEIEVNTGALTTCQEEEKQFPMSTGTGNTALHTKGREVPERASLSFSHALPQYVVTQGSWVWAQSSEPASPASFQIKRLRH